MLDTPEQRERARVAVALVAECRGMLGVDAAFDLWHRLGLPDLADIKADARLRELDRVFALMDARKSGVGTK